LVLVDVAVKLVYAAFLLPYGELRGAEDFYDDIARSLVAGHGYVIAPGGDPILWRAPAYPLFLAAVYALAGDSHLAVVAAHVLLDALTCVVLFVIARSLYETRFAAAAVLLYIVYPFAAYYTVSLLTEPLFTLLLAVTLLQAERASRRGGAAAFLLTGGLVGIATLCRTSIMYFPIVIVVRQLRAARSVRRAATALAAVAAGMLVVLLPWAVRNYRATGEIVLVGTGAGYNFWLGNHQPTAGKDLDELSGPTRELLVKAVDAITGGAPTRFGVEQDRRFYAAALRDAAAHPLAALSLVARKAWRFWFQIYHPDHQRYRWLLVPIQALLLAGCAIGVSLLRSERAIFYPLAAIVYFNVIHALTLSTFRYSLPVMPYVIMFAVYGAARTAGARPSHFGLAYCM
jgi:4-amino-4-deoxy-L-arabinose transferase-like glycosyltransferase